MEVYEDDGGYEDDERNDNGEDDILDTVIFKVNRARIVIFRFAKEEDRKEIIENHPYRDSEKEDS